MVLRTARSRLLLAAVCLGCALWGPRARAELPTGLAPQTAVLPDGPTPSSSGSGGEKASDGPVVDTAEYSELNVSQRLKGHFLGVMADLGLVDGLMISAVYRPIDLVQVHAGGGTNFISPGLRLGAVLTPLGTGPALAVDVGHYFAGDANAVARWLSSSDFESNAVLQNLDYNFINLHVGMQLDYRRFTFFARGGISYLWTGLNQVERFLTREAIDEQANVTFEVRDEPSVRGVIPSLKLGFMYF